MWNGVSWQGEKTIGANLGKYAIGNPVAAVLPTRNGGSPKIYVVFRTVPVPQQSELSYFEFDGIGYVKIINLAF